jgi:hypothetical protein
VVCREHSFAPSIRCQASEYGGSRVRQHPHCLRSHDRLGSASPTNPSLFPRTHRTAALRRKCRRMEVITKIPPSDLSSPQHSFVRSLVRLSCSALLLFGFLDSCRSFLTFAPSSICFGVRRPPSQGHCRPTATCANCTDSEQDIRIIPSQPSSLVRTDLSLVL